PPASDGVVPAEALVAALEDDTVLLCLMLANNELGTLQPVAEVAAEYRRRGVPVLCDAVQAVGKVRVSAPELGVDYLTLGAHKFHGPLGAAALWIRKGAPFDALLAGAPQEAGRRPSTENVPALVGLGAASQLAAEELEERGDLLTSLRARLEGGLARLPQVRLHCTGSPRLPHTTNAAFLGTPAQLLVPALDAGGFAVSAGAACGAGKAAASPTLKALGLDDDEALCSLRISFGIANRAHEVDAFLAALPATLSALPRR
ncbi:MAG: aminotransferase class V-fold PLP-dependent enzyme, partial [Acidobacteria bacterium]|nr:aminotransferase class V-fold PLP-dependent enzyme [Acidobacteriota bacterium]